MKERKTMVKIKKKKEKEYRKKIKNRKRYIYVCIHKNEGIYSRVYTAAISGQEVGYAM